MVSLTPTIDKILALETSRSCTEFWLGQEPRRPILRKGTGKQVAQKSGLNRAILGGSPFEQRRQLQYKAVNCSTRLTGGVVFSAPCRRRTPAAPARQHGEDAVRYGQATARPRRSWYAWNAGSQPMRI